jgi:hypothetical protein
MPFFGVQGAPSFNLGNGNLGTGTRLGGLAGGLITRWLSLNGAITVDFGNRSMPEQGYPSTLTEWLLTFSPLFHVGNLRPNDWRPILAGPKLGLLRGSGDGYYYGDRFNWYGWTYGGELGGFIHPFPTVSFGVMFSIDYVRPSIRTCTCNVENDVGRYPPRYYVWSAMLAMLF